MPCTSCCHFFPRGDSRPGMANCPDCSNALHDDQVVCPRCGTLIDPASIWPPRLDSMRFDPPDKPRSILATLRHPATIAGILVAWGCLFAGGVLASSLAGDAAFVLAIVPPLIAGLALQKWLPAFARGLLFGFPTALAISPLALAALGLYSYFTR